MLQGCLSAPELSANGILARSRRVLDVLRAATPEKHSGCDGEVQSHENNESFEVAAFDLCGWTPTNKNFWYWRIFQKNRTKMTITWHCGSVMPTLAVTYPALKGSERHFWLSRVLQAVKHGGTNLILPFTIRLHEAHGYPSSAMYVNVCPLNRTRGLIISIILSSRVLFYRPDSWRHLLALVTLSPRARHLRRLFGPTEVDGRKGNNKMLMRTYWKDWSCSEGDVATILFPFSF